MLFHRSRAIKLFLSGTELQEQVDRITLPQKDVRLLAAQLGNTRLNAIEKRYDRRAGCLRQQAGSLFDRFDDKTDPHNAGTVGSEGRC